MALLESSTFRRDVPIVERVERNAELLEELEGHFHTELGVADRVGAVIPRPECRTNAERVGEGVAEGMPVHHREPEVLLHRLPVDDLVGIIMFEF